MNHTSSHSTVLKRLSYHRDTAASRYYFWSDCYMFSFYRHIGNRESVLTVYYTVFMCLMVIRISVP